MTLSCYHCSLDVPDWADDSLRLLHDNQALHFCCPACKAITEMILGQGLGDYYAKREGQALLTQKENPDFLVWDNVALQTEFVTNQSDTLHIKLFIEGMHCTACAWLIEHHLKKQHGVVAASVNYQQQALMLQVEKEAASVSQLMHFVAEVGYRPYPFQSDQIQRAQQKERKTQLKRLGITALLMMQLVMLAAGVYAGDYLGISPHNRQLLHAFGLVFSLPLLYFSALPFVSSAFMALKNKTFNMDVNITLAIFGLYGGSVVSVVKGEGDVYFDSIAMLCLFILIARFIEFTTRQKLSQSKGLLPRYVNKKEGDGFSTCLLEDMQCGDTFLVKPGETLAFDGCVIEGDSTVSEAVITGESVSIRKQINDSVLAGSTNHDGKLLIRVTQSAGENLIDRIDTLASNASSPKKRVDDKFSALFTGVIGLLAIATYIVWLFIDAHSAFWIALSVLVISCPCALSLAAPTARAMIQYKLRQSGILIKNSDVLEKASVITHIFFDKTGTLTQGDLQRVRCINLSKNPDAGLIEIASALEKYANHPIADAFNSPNPPLADNVSIMPMHGIEGVVRGVSYRIGNADFCAQWIDAKPHPDSGNTWIGLCTPHQFLAWFELKDTLRRDAATTITHLKKRKIQLHILSGDSSAVVDQIADDLVIPFIKSASSEQKMAIVQQRQKEGSFVMMVGDGINDAPSLSSSHLSLTLDNASDWVKNQTDVVLLAGELQGIEKLLDSAASFKKIHRQNIAWALGYNALAIPLAMAGFVTPLFAALGMSLSSIVVVLNSRRLH